MNKVPQILLILDWYDHRIHQGIINFSKDKNWNIFCMQRPSAMNIIPNPKKIPVPSWKFDGAIVLIGFQTTADFLKLQKIPTVNLGCPDFGLNIPRFITDNEAIGEIAAEHFLERGFTNFYVPKHRNVPVYRQRYESFRKYLIENGGYECEFLSSSSFSHDPNYFIPENFLKHSPNSLKKELVNLRFPAALFAYEDNLAAEWMMLANYLQIKVPDQLAILGADNNPLIVETFQTQISSIETDQEGLGYAAAGLLADILDGKEKMNNKTFLHQPVSVVTRRSTDTIASKNPLINQALKIIHEDISINASQLAEKLSITQQGLQQAFRRHFHLSPAQTIRHLRIREIKHLLTDKKIPIRTISKSTGFSSIISFSQFFKRETGMNPGQYRKQYK